MLTVLLLVALLQKYPKIADYLPFTDYLFGRWLHPVKVKS